MNKRVTSQSMGQVLAVFWAKGVLLKDTGAAMERARALTMQRRGCCVRVVTMERGEGEKERLRCRVPVTECKARNGETAAGCPERRQTGPGAAAPSHARRGGGAAATAAPWRRARLGTRARPRPGAEGRGGSCRQEASRDWAFPSEGSAVSQHLIVLQVVLRSF